MKQQFVKAGTIIMVTAIIFGLNSCQDFDPTNEEVYVKTSYEKNFKSTFGEIDPNQCWDLTKTMPRTAKYNVEEFEAKTRAHTISGYTDATSAQVSSLVTYVSGSASSHDNWYTVQEGTLKWMKNTLKEGQNNHNLGTSFALVPPSNQFAIIPIYQGQAGMVWDLHLVDKVSKLDYKIWTKSQGILVNGATIGTGGNTLNANTVISQPMIINSDAIEGHEFFFYLKVTTGNSIYANVGDVQRSDEGMMLSLNCPIPTNLDNFTNENGSLVMIVGCEDAHLTSSDWDFNDIVFIIVGYPLIPDLIEYYHKRYLCEDLGNTYDFDFNDIVVDVDQTSYIQAYMETINGQPQIVRRENPDKREQYATIKHLCGTKAFQVKVGDYTFPTVTNPTDETTTLNELTRATGWNPVDENSAVTKKITGWDKDQNNISITDNGTNNGVFTEPFGTEPVEENAQDHIYKITFPGNGEVPFIIAVDQTVGWMEEYQHIPESWWKISPTNP